MSRSRKVIRSNHERHLRIEYGYPQLLNQLNLENCQPPLNVVSRKLRLLVLSRDLDTFVGGVVSYVRNQRNAMSTAVELQYMTIGSRIRESFAKKIVRIFADPLHFRARLTRNRVDVVQVNSSLKAKPLIRDSIFCWLTGRSRNTDLLVVFHGWDSKVAATVSNNALIKAWFKRSVGRASSVVILSHRFIKEAKALGLPESSIHVLPSMFDDRDFGPFRERPVRKENLVLFMSRLDPKKGALELVKAFEYGARTLWPTWRLVIAGDGPVRAAVEEYVKATGMSDRITVAGAVTGPSRLRLFEGASVFALPTSDDEGLPISVLEGMAAGCALLTTSVGGLAEVLEDKRHGVILTSVSVDTVSAGLESLICQADLRDLSQKNCHRLAWEQFSSSKVVGKFEQILFRLGK